MSEDKTCFIDTNIWLYAFTDNDADKKERAQALIKASQPIVSLQVINEICVNLLKRAKFQESQLTELIETFYSKYEVVEFDKELLLSASQLRQEYALSYWDSLIVVAALVSGAKHLYSEDMQHGLVIRKHLTITNPFK